jgi:hypothetical protein
MATFGWAGGTGSVTFYQSVCNRPHVPPGKVCVDPAVLAALNGQGGSVIVPAEFLRDVLKLAHPDLHTEARKERAHKVASFVTSVLSRLPK